MRPPGAEMTWPAPSTDSKHNSASSKVFILIFRCFSFWYCNLHVCWFASPALVLAFPSAISSRWVEVWAEGDERHAAARFSCSYIFKAMLLHTSDSAVKGLLCSGLMRFEPKSTTKIYWLFPVFDCLCFGLIGMWRWTSTAMLRNWVCVLSISVTQRSEWEQKHSNVWKHVTWE